MSTSGVDSGNHGGSDSTDLKSLLVFGIAYGVATTVVVKTIDRFTSGRRKEDHKGTAKTAGTDQRAATSSYCEHLWDFYKDCTKDRYSDKRCETYREVIKKCHQASGVGDTVSNPPMELLLMSYTGCKYSNPEWKWESHCKKYLQYMK